MNFLKNIFWLNIKKLKTNTFWRVIYILINLMLFLATIYTAQRVLFLSGKAYFYIFVLVSLSNTLFLYIKFTSDISAVSLYRSLGASKSFIMVNNIVEGVIHYFIALFIFSLLIIFFKYNGKLFLLSLLEVVLIIIESVIFSLITVMKAEKFEKA